MNEKQQPWGKWFWGDWRKDARLRRCGYAARGLWADMLSLLGGECDRFGYLMMEGQPLTPADLAGLLGGSERDVAKMLAELEGKRVFSRTGAHGLEQDLLLIIPEGIPAGVIFSRRMVRDKAKAELDRANGRTGGNPALKAAVNGGVKPPDKAQKPESESKSKKKELALTRFDDFWSVCSKKVGRGAAEKAWPTACALADPDILITAMKAYAHTCLGKDKQFIVHPATWLNGKRWLDDGVAPAAPVSEAAKAAASTAWAGRAAPLVEKIGPVKFQTWFGDASLEDGPPRKIIFPAKFKLNWARQHFGSEIERAFGPCELELAA